MSKSWSSSTPWGRAPRPIEFRPSILGRAFFQILQLESWAKFWELKPPLASTVHHSQLKRKKIFFSKKFLCRKVGRALTPWGWAPRPLEFRPSILGRAFFQILRLWVWGKKWELKPPPASMVRHSQLNWRNNIFLKNFLCQKFSRAPSPEVELLDLLNFDPASLVELFFRYSSWKAEKKIESWNHPLRVRCVTPSSIREKIYFRNFFYVENFVEPPPLRSSSSTYWISTQHPRSSFFLNTAVVRLRKKKRAKTTPCEYDASFPAQLEKKYFFEKISVSKI
jgi:hypothetical protein